MNKLKLASGVILVFFLGVLAGSLGTGIYYKKRVEKFEAGGPPVSERVKIVLGRFSDELNLTSVQKGEVEKIIKAAQEKILAIGRKSLPEIEKINEDTFASIKEKLTDEQKAKLNTLVQRMKEVHNRFPSGDSRTQRTPNQSRPQGAPEQGLPQLSPEGPPQKGMPEQNLLNVTPDSISHGGVDSSPSQRGYMRLFGELKSSLSLSQEQNEKVRSIMEESSEERKRMIEKYIQEQQKADPLKNNLMEIEKSVEKKLSNILTKEQMEKYHKAKESGAIKLSQPDMTSN
jgi:hypothetical protein